MAKIVANLSIITPLSACDYTWLPADPHPESPVMTYFNAWGHPALGTPLCNVPHNDLTPGLANLPRFASNT